MPEIVSNAAQVPVNPPVDMMTPLASKALFWRVRHLENSPFLCHVPFLFWLLETQRPTCAVQLGLQDQVVYSALCQALDMLGVDASCYGIAGFDPAPSVEALDRLEALNADLYDGFSRIFRNDPSQVLRRVPTGSINFILVDGPLDDAALAAVETDWLGALSPDGVLVLHGFDTHFATGPARALADRLMATHPTILMEGGDGLLVVLGGAQPADKLRRMAELQLGEKGHGEIRQVFSRLGKALHYEALARANGVANRGRSEAQLEAAAAAHAEALTQVSEAHAMEMTQAAQTHAADLAHQQVLLEESAAAHAAALADQEAAHAKALAQVSETHVAEMAEAAKAHAVDLEKTLNELQACLVSLADVTADRDRLAQELQALHRESAAQISAKEQAMKTLKAQQDAAGGAARQAERDYRQQIAAQKNELQSQAELVEKAEKEASDILLSMVRRCESLSGEILEGQRALKMSKAREVKRFEELGLLTRMLQHERALRAETAKLAEEMIQSSSWKMTKPARKFVQLIRGE